MPLPKVGTRPQHIRSLDGLRGLAVLAVMASHLFPGNVHGVLTLVRAVFSFGATGVDLFFVLSGFLITGILYDSLHDTGYFRKFYARRALRIFPLYYGVLLVCFALSHGPDINTWGARWAYLFYLQNTDIAGPCDALRISHIFTLDHFWSLAVEEQFYLVWPMLVYFVRDRIRLLWVCFGLSAVAFVLRIVLGFNHVRYNAINRDTLCRMDALLIGGALALLMHGPLRERILQSAKALFFTVVAVVAALNLVRPVFDGTADSIFAFNVTYLSLRYTLMALGSAALVMWCLQPGSIASRIFEGRTLRWFGRYSYGLYVLHYVALPVMLQTFRGWIAHVTLNKGIQVVGAGLLSFLLAVIAAYLSYNLYEKRFLRLKRLWDYERPVHMDGATASPQETTLKA